MYILTLKIDIQSLYIYISFLIIFLWNKKDSRGVISNI